MNSKKMSLEEGLRQAIEAEIDGYHFYMMAASKCEDPKGCQVFEQMAQEELEHVRFLRAQYAAVEKGGKPSQSVRLTGMARLDVMSPIFSDKIKGRLKDAHFEMSALSIAIQMELSAVNFYRDRAGESDDETVKQFFNELSQWESGHYNVLLNQQQALKEDYWTDGGFSPF
jgi:rubrerythrin